MDWELDEGSIDVVAGVGLPTRPNVHCVDHLLQAAGPGDLVASRDIRDRNGLLLWAKNRPITPDIRERLLAKRLLEPLEVSLTYRHSLAPADLGIRRHPTSRTSMNASAAARYTVPPRNRASAASVSGDRSAGNACTCDP